VFQFDVLLQRPLSPVDPLAVVHCALVSLLDLLSRPPRPLPSRLVLSLSPRLSLSRIFHFFLRGFEVTSN
jgi:hypothetical protein